MASITLEARQSLVALYVGMFQAAPGTSNLSTMVQSYESGKTLKQIAADLDNADFRSQYPAFLTAEEFSDRLVSRLLGSEVGSAQTSWATNWVTNKLNSGIPDTEVIVMAVNALRATTNTAYDNAKASINNKVEVAEYYSVTKAQDSSSLSTLQSVISGVTSDSTTVTTAKTTVDTTVENATGQTYTLTNSSNQTTGGADNFTGTSSADTFLATADQALDNGDVIDGAGGNDSLTARYSIDGDTTINASVSNVETVIIDTDEGAAGDHELNFGANFTGLQKLVIQDAAATDAAGTDDINVTSIALGVTLGITRGDGVFDVDFQYASTFGTADTATLELVSADVETVTIAGIETLTINAVSGAANGIDTLTTTAASTLNITGAGNLTLGNVDDATDVIDASASTGVISISGIGDGTTATNANTITAGSGNTTINIGANLTTFDTITGGAGTDRIIVSVDETTAISGVTAVEELEIDVADIDVANGGGADGSGTVTLSGLVSSDITRFVLDVTTAADGDTGTVTVNSLDDGDVITFQDGGSDTTVAGAGAGISLATSVATDTATNSLTLEFDYIGAVDADASNNNGYAQVEVDEIEFLTVQADRFSEALKTSGVEVLTAQSAKTMTFTGAGDFAASSVVNTTALTTIDASAATGALTLTGVDSSVLTYTGSTGNDSLTMAGLNASDTLDGGAGTDTLIATAVTGLTATTGKLNISNFETVNLRATGANTIDASLLSGVTTLNIAGATPGTQTITNLAAGQAIGLGDLDGTGNVFDNGDTVAVSLADATGTADALTINVNNEAAGTDAALDISGVESITLAVAANQTQDMTLNVTEMESDSLTVTGGGVGALLTLGTLDAKTDTIDLSGYSGEVSFSAASATDAVTLTASSAAADDNYTLSGNDDTATIGTTGAVDVDIDGGNGNDVLNLTVTTGFVDTGEIDNIETINFTVASGVDISIGANGTAATDADGISDATAVTIAGGNSLSTFEVGDASAASADRITAAVDINAGSFEGNIFLEYAADIFTATTDVTGGALATDRVYALFDTNNTSIALPLSGVETFTASLNSGDDAAQEQYTFDVDGATGLTKAEFFSSDGENTLLDVNDYVDTISIQLGATVAGTQSAFDSSSELDVALKSSTGTADVLNIILHDTDDAGGTIDIDAAGVEVLNLSQSALAESHTLNLAGVTATGTSKVTINLSGGNTGETVTLSDVSTSTNVINAAGFDSALVISDRGSSAMTITGGDAADTIRMENSADVLDGAGGADTLTIVQNAVLGGFQVNLASTGDQVTTYNGSANSAVQQSFANADLSGISGSFGADITAISTGSTIRGTTNADVITLGAGTDTVVSWEGTADTVNSFTYGASGDQIDFDISGLETASAVADSLTLDLILANDASSINNDGSDAFAIAELSADNTAATAGADLYVLVGATYNDVAAAVDALETSGNRTLTGVSGNEAANDAILIAWSDGTDAYISIAYSAAADWDDGDDDGVINDATFTGVNLVKLAGNTSITASEFNNANFDWIA